MQLNQQPIEKPSYREDGFLEVHSCFKTIQGEGPYAGMPAVFVRLAGCNLSGTIGTCRFCDTDYTSKRELLSPVDLAAKVSALECPGTRWVNQTLVVITGGEPFRQNLHPFDLELAKEGFRVQIETNGTLFPPKMPEKADIIVSPKTPIIQKGMDLHAKAYKYILEAGYVDEDGLPTRSLGGDVRPARPGRLFRGEVYVQPCDEQDEAKNKANLAAAVESCMKHGYRLSIQGHKIAGLP